jgi:cephalosporin-C deacetylase-like acetyl esterase
MKHRFFLILGLIGCLLASPASGADKIALSIDVEDPDYIFMAPAQVAVRLNVFNPQSEAVEGYVLVELTTDDHRPLQRDSLRVSVPAGYAWMRIFTVPNPQPGFYRYSATWVSPGETLKKRVTVGYEPEKIVSPVDSHADFRAFWDQSLNELAQVKPEYKLTFLPDSTRGDYDMYLVEMRSLGNELIRGFYARPRQAGKHPVVVKYMGYGSYPSLPTQTYDGFAHFVLSIRGQALNTPTNRFGKKWILYGLNDKADYYYRGAFCDAIRALDFVCSRPEIDAEQIVVRGGSQGGALSFAAAALDKRIKAAAPTIPFLSDYRDYFRIAPWPRRDFDEYMREHPEADWDEIYTLLTYFDIKNLAPWITCPLLMGIGVQDGTCPPHINFAAYNQVQSPKHWVAYPRNSHNVGPDFDGYSLEFFRAILKQ